MKKAWALGTKIYILLGVLVGFLAVTGFFTINESLKQNRLNKMAYLANQMTDHLMEATGQHAIERGVSAVIFAKKEGELSELHRIVLARRSSGDKAYFEGIRMAEEISRLAPTDEAFRKGLEDVRNRRRELEEARERVDGYVKNHKDPLPVERWLRIATGNIYAQVDLIQVGSRGKTPREYAQEMNLTLKYHIWAASEFAGIIRAQVGTAIGSAVPAAQEQRDKIHNFQIIVDEHISAVNKVASQVGADLRLVDAIEQMKQSFMVEFGPVRERIFSELATGKYSISSAEWIKSSTKAIDSILAVSVAASLKPSEELAKAQTASQFFVYISVSLLLLALSLSLGSVWYFRLKILGPVNSFIEDLTQLSEDVRKASRDVASSSQSLSSTASEQAASIEETASSLEEFSSMVKNNVGQAEKVRELASQTQTASQNAGKSMQDLVLSMKEIKESNSDIQQLVRVIGDIGEKTKVIDDIVFQTKILSFNASVEAERAGEYGRGFAVVAQEVSNLAEMSGKAANEIAAMVNESIKTAETITVENRQKVDVGDELVQQTYEVLSAIDINASMVTQNADQILSASRDQASGVSQVNIAVAQLDKATQQTAVTAEDAAYASEKLDEQARSLGEIVNGLLYAIMGSTVAVGSEKGSAKWRKSGTASASTTTLSPHSVTPPPHNVSRLPLADSSTSRSSSKVREPMKKVVGDDWESNEDSPASGDNEDSWERL